MGEKDQEKRRKTLSMLERSCILFP
jgi:hypothetical protein